MTSSHAPAATILVTDDLAIVRMTLRRMLEPKGYRVLEAASVDEALACILHEPVQLVLCDIQMPGRPGLDLVRALAPCSPDIAILMVSGVSSDETALECLEMGAFGYVLKPFNAREILLQVRNALRRRTLELAQLDIQGELSRQVDLKTLEIRNSRAELAERLLSASEHRDNETGAHIRRIGLYAAAMARRLGWEDEAVECILAAAPMHDLGKIGIPDAILRKPGPLDDAEWAVMRTHPALGADILAGSQVPFIQMGARIAAYHHEKWDGSGYPARLAGEAIPIEARIVALADVFDALCSPRHYKAAWSEEEALAYMRTERGRHFDPGLFAVFEGCVEEILAIRRQNPDAA
jgi:putative two-component system response regulator